MQKHKIVVLGSGGVGKTAIVVNFVENKFIQKYDPTIEDMYMKKVEINGEIHTMIITDTAGQEEYAAMKDQYIRYGSSFILTYSVTARHTFDELHIIKDQIHKIKEIENIPMVLVGNKIDLEETREVSKAEGLELAKIWEMPFLEVSAKQKINVDAIFTTMLDEILDRTNRHEPKKKKNKCSIL